MMKLLRAGISTLWHHKWLVLPLYAVHLIYGLRVGSKIRSEIEATLRHSTLRATLQDGYQSNVVADMIHHQGLDLAASLQTIIYSLAGCLLLSTFVQSGTIAALAQRRKKISVVAQLAGKYFLPHLAVTLLGLVVLCLALALMWGPFLAYSEVKDLGFLEVYHSEKSFFIGLYILIAASYIAAVLASGWAVRAKGNIALGQPAHLWPTAKLILRRALPLVSASLLLLAVAGIFSYAFTSLISSCAADSWWSVLAKVFWGQCMIITYCKLRLMWYGGVLGLRE